MAVIQSGESAALQTVDPVAKAARSTLRPIEGEHYSIAGISGLMTGITANDPLYAFRWGSATRNALIWRIKATLVVVSGFTAAQEIGADVIAARSYTADHTGGTALTLTSNNGKLRTSFTTTALSSARIASTSALTGGTITLDDQPIAGNGASALAAAATVHNPSFTIERVFTPSGGPLQLTQNEGFLIRNRVSMGAGGTARLYVEVDWSEVGTSAGW